LRRRSIQSFGNWNGNVTLHICSTPVFVAIVATGLTTIAQETVVNHSFLHQLTIPEDSLPAGCEIQEIPPDALPVKNLKNRSITTDPRAFVIGDERLDPLIDAKSVEAMYLAIYQEKNDFGIFGWAFRSTDSAKDAHRKLAASYANEPGRMRFWLLDKYVVWLWRDPGVSHSCFDSFSTHIQHVLEKLAMEKGAHIPSRVSGKIMQLQEFDRLGQCFSFHAKGIVVHDEGKRFPKEVDLLHYGGRLYANHYSNDFAYYSGKGAILHLGKGEMDDFSEAPRDGYTYVLRLEDLRQGHCYCVRAGRGKQHGLIRVLAVQQQPALLKFEWRYPLPVAKRSDPTPDVNTVTPNVTLKAGAQKDADAALAVLRRFLQLWEEDKYEKASLLVVEPLRKEFIAHLQNRPIELKSIDDITIYEAKDGFGARVHIAVVPKGGIGMDMVFQDGKWWITGD
jgi:hypothetical protein